MNKLIINYTFLTILLFILSACGEPRTYVPLAKYEPDYKEGSIEIGASIEFFNDTGKAEDTYGHLRIADVSSFLAEQGFTKDDRIPFEIKGTDITGEVSQHIYGNLTDLPQETLETIHDEKPLILLLHLSEDQIVEIPLQHRIPDINY